MKLEGKLNLNELLIEDLTKKRKNWSVLLFDSGL